MNQPVCPKCQHKDATKSGIIAGRQRYRCKNCGYHFTVAKIGREVNTYYVVKALQLYLEGVSYREIERLLGVSHVSVMNWVKKYAVQAPRQTETRPSSQVLTLPELQAYFQQPENLVGGGTVVTEAGDKFLLMRWEGPAGKKS
ncbi:IS1/IS1595 family N-terminal zinc-binding domain-containing protein [Hymenobacter cellulosivorans]|uniref:Helix-turn-helix domain-containing protein n=1 Tax=Hymenobacter cellulosivorans TaxID=2932249 RepID=A0ABY4F468_9BACT|nr:helix-turn-helix domain-containing protein [Hymenobacter cellulosivorans]UOQ51444.1 helix-turn-helix domain-containing protein [Hymenobacter cellulosivorans]